MRSGSWFVPTIGVEHFDEGGFALSSITVGTELVILCF